VYCTAEHFTFLPFSSDQLTELQEQVQNNKQSHKNKVLSKVLIDIYYLIVNLFIHVYLFNYYLFIDYCLLIIIDYYYY